MDDLVTASAARWTRALGVVTLVEGAVLAVLAARLDDVRASFRGQIADGLTAGAVSRATVAVGVAAAGVVAAGIVAVLGRRAGAALVAIVHAVALAGALTWAARPGTRQVDCSFFSGCDERTNSRVPGLVLALLVVAVLVASLVAWRRGASSRGGAVPIDAPRPGVGGSVA